MNSISIKDQRIRFALTDQLLIQIRQSTFANLFLVTISAIVIQLSFPGEHVYLWLLSGYAILLPRFILLRNEGMSTQKTAIYDRLELRILIALLLSGLHWGSAAWLFLDIAYPDIFMFVIAAILGVVCSTLASLTIRPLAWLVFAGSVLILTIIKLITIEIFGLAAMGAGMLVFLTMLSRNLGEQIKKSITQEFRNAELLEEVSLAKEAAEKANMEKSLFMAATSHDLRQPLHAQSLLLEVLRHRVRDTDLKSLAKKLIYSNDALNSLFNSLLEVSQLDAGTITVHAGDHSLTGICTLIVDEFHEVAAKKHLYLEHSGDDCIVYTDSLLFERILRNLVSNAIKFTTAGGVHLHTEEMDSNIKITISDTGIGIPLADHERIFNEYTQLGNKARDRSQGVGLGLALVRRLSRLLEHEIEMSSIPGHGTSFTVSLPKGDSLKVIDIKEEPVIEKARDIDVLIIDDEQPILDAMQDIMDQWSYGALTTSSYAAAVEIIGNSEFRPDLIICDYRLNEEINGVEAVQLLRNKLGAKIPAILISGDTDPRILEKIQNEDLYLLHKPLKPAKLRRVINILLDQNIPVTAGV